MEDKIEDIPKTMEKFLGCSGKMIRPSPVTVKKIVQKIRKGRLVTIDNLREKLASDFDVNIACPSSTLKALAYLSKEPNPCAYWRVIKRNGDLITKFPGGEKGHAQLLIDEGFEIDFKRKNPIIDFESKLHKFRK